ncbi:MAG TPA: aminofutalosine synthase MqnE [Planctomycetota bacterium]|jgi:aminodeoxyfutalosine synthase|nr:aminofutalosine synthase MqnE [Planctomycetota bacterium]HJM40310.1 aminofutalosine synthase MqnE [Planctomycetota bacterium]|tara:strand:- start:10688 stop:11842 length:1155 start_codon:yes stop_codon:yes gene_type:complete
MINHLEERAARTGLGGIPTLVQEGQRLSEAHCLALLKSDDLALMGLLANQVREKRHGDVAYYNVNIHVNYTNYCNQYCDFCAFQRRPKDDGAYCMTPEQIHEELSKANPEATEVHMVAGVWPALPYEYFLDIVRAAKSARPNIHVKAFTMVEIDQIVKTAGKPLGDVLDELKEAGLGSMPGGGAEIFSERVRQELYPKKMGAERWIELARDIHNHGYRTNCTMLYGMTETLEERADHLNRLRNLQDETGGFQTYIPLAFHPENTPGLSHLPQPGPTERLKAIAIGRLFLDNIAHIKAYWVMLGLPVAQLALGMGADDIDGTVTQEKVYHDAGAGTPENLDRDFIHRLIREAHRQPVERGTLYEVIREFPIANDSIPTSPTPLSV